MNYALDKGRKTPNEVKIEVELNNGASTHSNLCTAKDSGVTLCTISRNSGFGLFYGS